MVQREVGERLAARPGQPAVRGRVGEGGVLRRGDGARPWCRRPCSCPGPRSTRCSCGSSARRAAGDVPSVDDAVRARAQRVRAAAQDAARGRCGPCSASATLDSARLRRASRRPRAPRRSGSTSGPRSPGVRRMLREARPGPRHRVPQAHPVAPGAAADATTATTTSRRWSSRSVSPTTCSRRTRCRARAACRSRSSRDDASAEDVPADHRNLAFIAAEKLLVRAGRSGHGVRARAAQAHPRGRGARRRVGRRRGRAARGAPPARRRHRRRRRARARRRGRFGRVVLRARWRGVDARPGRESSSRSRSPPGSRSSSRSRRSGCRRPTCTARGTSSAGPGPSAPVPAPRRVASILPELAQRPRARGRGARAAPAWSSALRSRRRPAVPRCWPGAARPTWCRSPTPAPAGARRLGGPTLRVPVVGTTSVSRGVRLG